MPVPTPTSDLATPTDLATYLGEPPFEGDALNQALLACRLASATVRSRTGLTFAAGTATLNLPESGDMWLALPPRVASVADVSIDATALAGGSGVGDYTLVGSRLFRYAGWRSYGYGPPVVTLTATFDGTVPDDVLGATLAVAADLFENPRGLTSESIDDYTWRGSDSERGSAAEIELAAVIQAYRRRPLTVALS